MNNWFGVLNPLSKMVIAAVLCFFPVLVNTLRGLTSVRPSSIELMRSYAAGELEIFRRVSPSPVAPNLLVVNVQPDEGIAVRFEAKLPGMRMQLAPVMMNFRYGTAFGEGGSQVGMTLEALLAKER